ncbi:MAG: long-chain acyl-CoA synthetase [Pseudoalteromonas rhizosphaerae]|jgi:long-chain acyl-CoA synthetase|uniref:Acyl--CoA ligase n=1 Tax=Pseudoalteromonas neustonica TaxID=1840331 RepID=A0ABY3FC11_9GAMM|nr:class I adenylate-forming enzyme family protein [Pseudoalteromonas neustonica]TVU82403.1 acyl--CoA ligase [Pseudoalteromonas neustonica]
MHNKNIYQLVQSHTVTQPEKIACIYQQTQINYQQLINKVDSLAAGLTQLGIKQGHKVALFCPNNLEFTYCLLAAAKLGIALAPLPLTLKGEALSKALQVADCEYAIAWISVAEQLVNNDVLATDNIITIGGNSDNLIDLVNVMSASTAQYDEFPVENINLPYILTMTSGSTGQPKPIVFTQATKIVRAFDATAQYYQLDKSDVVLVSTPLYHSLAQRSLLMPLMLGASVVILPKFSVNAWLDAINTHKISFLFAVSSQLKALIPEFAKAQLTSLKCVVSSSATLESDDKKSLLLALNCRFHECYGASEMGVISDFDITEPNVPINSVGKPLPNLKIKICDAERNTLSNGNIGEIACRSPTAFAQYYNLPEQTAQSYDSDGYFFTGDLGYLDDDNYLYYVGRTKEVIKSGGINVYPSDIELVTNYLPWIAECAAFGVSDDKFGEVILLSFVCNDTAPVNAKMQLQMHLFKELTDYQQPRILFEMKRLPKTEMGKIHKPSIKQAYLESCN